jgi:hypothetical protein
VRTTYSCRLWQNCLEIYSKRYQERVVGYAIRSWEGDPYALGKGGSSGRAGTQGRTKSWALNIPFDSRNITIY